MDPVTLIVSALAAGAATALKETVGTAITDAYSALKGLLRRKYEDVNIDAVERKPDSTVQRDAVAENLAEAGGGEDQELLELARQLVAAIREHEPAIEAPAGVVLKDVEAAFIRAEDIKSTGTGFSAERVKTSGGIDVRRVRAGVGDEASNPT